MSEMSGGRRDALRDEPVGGSTAPRTAGTRGYPSPPWRGRSAPGGTTAAERRAPLVVALVGGREAQARVRDALRGAAPVAFCDRAGELLETVTGVPVSAVILEPRDGYGTLTDAVARTICEGYPSVPVIAYADPSRSASGEILALARAGVHELVLRGIDDAGIAFRAALASAARQSVAGRVMAEISLLVPPSARALMRYCLEHAECAPSVVDVARALGVHRKTLVNRLREACLPPPSALIGWCRLLVAAQMLEDPLRPVEQIALELNFPSGTAFRNMLRRYIRRRPREVRAMGGLSYVLRAFKGVLAPAANLAAADHERSASHAAQP